MIMGGEDGDPAQQSRQVIVVMALLLFCQLTIVIKSPQAGRHRVMTDFDRSSSPLLRRAEPGSAQTSYLS